MSKRPPKQRTGKRGRSAARVTSARSRSTTRARIVRPRNAGIKKKNAAPSIAATEVTPAELRLLKREIERRVSPTRWNPNPEDVQKSVAQLVLTLVEFLRQLMERQAIRRMEQQTLTAAEVEAVGLALMQLEHTVHEIGRKFGISPEELNLDLGAIKLM